MHAARPYGDKKLSLLVSVICRFHFSRRNRAKKVRRLRFRGQEAIKSRRDAWGRASGHERTQHECEEGRRHRGASFSDSFLVKFTEY